MFKNKQEAIEKNARRKKIKTSVSEREREGCGFRFAARFFSSPLKFSLFSVSFYFFSAQREETTKQTERNIVSTLELFVSFLVGDSDDVKVHSRKSFFQANKKKLVFFCPSSLDLTFCSSSSSPSSPPLRPCIAVPAAPGRA